MITKKITITLLFSLTPLISLGMHPEDNKPTATLVTFGDNGFSEVPAEIGDPAELFKRTIMQKHSLQDMGPKLGEKNSDLMTAIYHRIDMDVINPDPESCKYLSKYKFYSHTQNPLDQETEALINSSRFAALQAKWQEVAKDLKVRQDKLEESIFEILRYKNERNPSSLQEAQNLLKQVQEINLDHYTALFTITCMNNMKYVDWQKHLAKLSGEIEKSK